MFKPGSDAHLKKIALWNGNVFQMENLRIILSGLSAEESLLLKKEFKWSVIKVMISIIKTRSSLIYFFLKVFLLQMSCKFWSLDTSNFLKKILFAEGA